MGVIKIPINQNNNKDIWKKEIKKYKYIAFGITNQCKNDKFIPFFDFDINDIIYVTYDLMKVRIKHFLSNIYLIKSKNGFNAFSLDMLSFENLLNIYKDCSFVDQDFIKFGVKRGFFTLRMGSDKIFISIIKSFSHKYTKSLPHKNFFVKIMNFPIKDNVSFNNNKGLVITKFPSNKHGIPIKDIEVEKWI